MADTFLTEAITQERKKQQQKDRLSLSPPKPGENPPESDLDRDKRLWKWTLKKIAFSPAEDQSDYYSKLPIRPGIHFYRALVVGKQSLDSLRVNIPESVMCFDQTYFLIYTDEVTGQLRRKTDASYQEFEQKVLDHNDQYVRRFGMNRSYDPRSNVRENLDGPFIIDRGPAALDWNMYKQVMTMRQQKERKVTLDNNKLEQRFIISRAQRATILRLVYNTKNSKSSQANYGYRIMNFRNIFDPDQKKSLTNKTTINTEEQNSFNIQLVKGAGLAEYEHQSEQVVAFLERKFPVRIRQAVFDFIQDPEGRIWLINMKAIELSSAISMTDIQGVGENQKTLDQLTCSVYCKLCTNSFKKDDASKVLTYKLLWELVQHLKKRNKALSGIKVSHSSTRPCRVCDVCYMLIVGEHELIEVEQNFAKAQNIPLGDIDVRVPIEGRPKHRPAMLPETLHQWRLLFFFTGVTDLQGNQVTDLKNLHVQYKIHQTKTCFKTQLLGPPLKKKESAGEMKPAMNSAQAFYPGNAINASKNLKSSLADPTSSQGSQKQLRFSAQALNRSSSQGQVKQGSSTNHDPNQLYQLKIKLIRVHYFFSEDIDIEKFLTETEVKMRITNGPEWTNYVAEGSTKTIHHFKNKQLGGQRHTAQVLMFFENSSYCVLNFQVGLFCDGTYNTGKLNLFKYNNVYFPDENYYNCNPFPPEWMEMFDPEGVNQHDSFEDQAKEIEAYSPKCDKDELNKMIDFNKYKENNKYNNIKGVINTRNREVKSATTNVNIISNRLLPQNKTQQPNSGHSTSKNKRQQQTLKEIDEQFLLQQYTADDINAEEIIFQEEKRKPSKAALTKQELDVYKAYDISDADSQGDEELNDQLNQELEQAKKLSRQSKSAQVLPPRPVNRKQSDKQPNQLQS